MCSLGKNIGYEQCGSGQKFLRPVLLIKKFNQNMFWAVPLTTKQKALYFYYNFTAPNGVKESAILSQLRLISVKRLTRKYFNVSKTDADNIRNKLVLFIKKNPALTTGVSKTS